MSALSLVRAHTSVDHRRLEGGLVVGRAGLTLAQYAGYLRVMRDTHRRVERALEGLGGWREAVPDCDRRVKTPALEADLRALGEPAGAGGPGPALPVETLAGAMGVAYVLEGSTLGGAVIARHVEATLGPAAPVRYLRVFGDELGAMWRSFCGAFEAFGAREGPGRACEAAAIAFRALEREFAREGLLS